MDSLASLGFSLSIQFFAFSVFPRVQSVSLFYFLNILTFPLFPKYDVGLFPHSCFSDLLGTLCFLVFMSAKVQFV